MLDPCGMSSALHRVVNDGNLSGLSVGSRNSMVHSRSSLSPGVSSSIHRRYKESPLAIFAAGKLSERARRSIVLVHCLCFGP